MYSTFFSSFFFFFFVLSFFFFSVSSFSPTSSSSSSSPLLPTPDFYTSPSSSSFCSCPSPCRHRPSSAAASSTFQVVSINSSNSNIATNTATVNHAGHYSSSRDAAGRAVGSSSTSRSRSTRRNERGRMKRDE
eukprot:gb/GEZN01013608.1/.p1 GENE.gb/GEZN01013608.1/~~gb/GEZN01013608.1/.p1  ORF type:complete len:133 (-),score=36.97 gb/GEZN01013608.1/:319-717(-)